MRIPVNIKGDFFSEKWLKSIFRLTKKRLVQEVLVFFNFLINIYFLEISNSLKNIWLIY